MTQVFTAKIPVSTTEIHICWCMMDASLFIITCLSTEEWTTEEGDAMYIYNIILSNYEETQVSFAEKWKHLEIIALIKLNQNQKISSSLIYRFVDYM